MQLSVLTFNLHNTYDRWLGRRELIVSGLMAHMPDVMLFQEVNFANAQARWLVNQLNLRAQTRLYSMCQAPQRQFLFGYFDGLAIISKHPIMHYEVLRLPDRRIALLANIELPTGQTVDCVTTHLTPGQFLPDLRYDQIMQLTGWLSIVGRSPYQIIGGDLNETPDSRSIKIMKQRYVSAWESLYGREPLATFPTALGDYPVDGSVCLDYIFTTSNISPIDASLFGNKIHVEDPSLFMSDHVGLLAGVLLTS